MSGSTPVRLSTADPVMSLPLLPRAVSEIADRFEGDPEPLDQKVRDRAQVPKAQTRPAFNECLSSPTTHRSKVTHTSLLQLRPKLDEIVLRRRLLLQRDEVLLRRLQTVQVRRDALRVARELLDARGQETLRLLRVLLQVVDAQAGRGGEAEELGVSWDRVGDEAWEGGLSILKRGGQATHETDNTVCQLDSW